jgi:hypothetical protein
MGSCVCCFHFRKVNPNRQIPVAKVTPVIGSPVLATLSKQDRPKPPASKPPIIEYKYSREIIDLRPADQARNLSKEGSTLPNKKDPIRILSKHILTTGAASNNPDSERKLIQKPKAVAVQLKKPEPQTSPNPKLIIEINKLQSLRLTRNESTQIPPSITNERALHDLSISNQSHQSFSGFNPSISSPNRSDIRTAKQIPRIKNVPNLLEKIQRRKLEEKHHAVSSQVVPSEKPPQAELNQTLQSKIDQPSGSSKSLLMSIRRRNKTDTEIIKSEKTIEEPTGLNIGNKRGFDHEQTMIRKIELFKANLTNTTHNPNRNLLAGILAQGLLELGRAHPNRQTKDLVAAEQKLQSSHRKQEQASNQPNISAPTPKQLKPKINELHNNSSIATISEKYSEEFEAESVEKQSNISLKHMYPNRQQLLDLKKRNLTDIKDLKKEPNLDTLFNGDQAKIEAITPKAIEQEEDESEELGDALFKLNRDDQSFG